MTRKRLVGDLRAIGITPTAPLLVHSSLSMVGFVVGGAAAVIDALLEVVGPDGTLMMPTHTWRWANQGLRVFDVRRSPSGVGCISESFRLRPDTLRSLHPTHSVAAVGPAAADLLSDHELAQTPCGLGTPYSRLLDAGGRILMLGVSLNRNTSFHCVEALADVPYLMQQTYETFEVTDQTGNLRSIPIRMHASAVPSRFAEMEPLLLSEGALRRGTVGKASAMLIDGQRFRDALVPRLVQDPEFLVQRGHGSN